MLHTIIKKRISTPQIVMSTRYQRLSATPSEKDGILCHDSTYEEVDFSQDSLLYKSSDFSIGNLMNTGSFDMLKPIFVSTLSDMDFADKFQDLNLNPKTE